jgi:hypothetical protein
MPGCFEVWKNEWFKMMSLLPDPSKIAVLGCNTMNKPESSGNLYIISMEGMLLYKYWELLA